MHFTVIYKFPSTFRFCETRARPHEATRGSVSVSFRFVWRPVLRGRFRIFDFQCHPNGTQNTSSLYVHYFWNRRNRYRVDRNSAMVELQTIITRLNCAQLRRPFDDLSCLSSINTVFKYQIFSNQSSTSTSSFKCRVILKLK